MSGINSLFGTAVSGLNAAGAIVNTAASNIANLDTQGYQAARVHLESAPGREGVEVGSVTRESDVDLPTEMVALRQGQTLYRANAAVIRVADQLTGTLLDMFDTGRRRN